MCCKMKEMLVHEVKLKCFNSSDLFGFYCKNVNLQPESRYRHVFLVKFNKQT